MNVATLHMPVDRIASARTREGDLRRTGKLALLALNLSLAGCFLALMATLGAVFLKVAGLL